MNKKAKRHNDGDKALPPKKRDRAVELTAL